MKKFIFMIVALMGMVMSVNAQTVESSRFTDNWSVGLKGGAVTPLNHSAFWGDMRGVVGLELKKEVTPIFGLGVEGEWTVNTSAWSRNVHSTNVFDHQLVGGFLTGNLTNAIAGYRGTPRLVEVEAVAGLGWLHTYLNSAEDLNGWYTKFGANVNFNLGHRHTRQCVMDGIAVMCISARIDHNAFRSVKVGVLNPINDGALMIALEHLYRAACFFTFFRNHM